jgi:isopenicillin N synthase-like dioxygenase
MMQKIVATTPVIDLGPYLFIGNQGVPQSLVERMFEETKRFHSLPIERKLGGRMTDKVVGYLPQGGQTQRTSKYGASHAAFDPPVFNLRLLHYPPREATLEGQFGIGPHTDYGYLISSSNTPISRAAGPTIGSARRPTA